MSHPAMLRCPWCVADGERSTIDVYGAGMTAMMWNPHYDEDGNYHTHDPNGSGRTMECSRGHRFAPPEKPCPSCDYGKHAAVMYERRCEASGREVGDDVDVCPDCGADFVRVVTTSPDGRIRCSSAVGATLVGVREGSTAHREIESHWIRQNPPIEAPT